MPLRFARNLSAADEIARHLQVCSSSFVPPLHSRVAIPDYAAKLAERAERFEAWDGPRLIGLVAIYRATETRQAFVSNVSVEPAFARQGIARRLLASAIAHVRQDTTSIALEVHRHAPALALYLAFGFREESASDNAIKLRLQFLWL